MNRSRLIFLLLALIYIASLICAWTFGPMLFDLPIMTTIWITFIGVGILCGVPCAIFCIRDFRRFQRDDRIKQNHCPTCNYDLRAHAPNQSCPECGSPIPKINHPQPSPNR